MRLSGPAPRPAAQRPDNGLAAGQAGLVEIYERRSGSIPEALRSKIELAADLSVLQSWLSVVATGTAEKIGEQLLRQGTV